MYMITLDNFENFVPYKIWMRGEEYYETDAVSELEGASGKAAFRNHRRDIDVDHRSVRNHGQDARWPRRLSAGGELIDGVMTRLGGGEEIWRLRPRPCCNGRPGL